jgi:hypothetical protein
VTDRDRVAALPDETPVESLPLPRLVANALRFGGVLTLGDLRAMRDHDLLGLRQFGHGALAEVRALVPAPAERTGGEVAIAGRVFTLGVVYAPPGTGSGKHTPRRLLGFSRDSPLPGGRVVVELVSSGRQEVMAGAVWAAWAGEPVEGVGR